MEQTEKSNNSQLAREIELALPVELSREEQTRLVREYCSSQFVSKGMCADFNIHDTGSGNPHAHILLTMRPLDEKGAWAAKSKKEYVLDESGEKILLPSGRYKTRKIDLMDWNRQENADLWRKAWADMANDFLEQNGSAERIDHRSNAERGIDEIPTVHMGVAACQMEKKGIATEKGELNRNIQKANRLIREIRAQIGKLKEWLAGLLAERETAPEQPPKSSDLTSLLMKYPIAEIAEILDKGSTTIKGALNELDTAGLLERERGGFSAPNRLYVKVPRVPQVQFSDQLMAGKPTLTEPENRPTDGQKTDLMMVGKPSPNQTTINNLTESQTMGASGEPPAPYGRYQNIFLSQTEYDELQAEYPDRLERFIEEMSRYLAANGKSYQNYAAALRIWAGNDKKGAPKKGIPDYSCKEGESL